MRISPYEALGPARATALDEVSAWLTAERQLTDDAETTEVTLIPVKATDFEKWYHSAAAPGERWLYATMNDGRMIAIDEPSIEGEADHAGAIVYPEMHSRAVAWWLVHAWRLIDLTEATLSDLQEWRITVAAVGARAALEEAGCLLHEARALTEAWAAAKEQPKTTSLFQRATTVRECLAPVLNKAEFGSRMKVISHPSRQATNVMTYIQKLGKALGRPEVEDWYEWLSDAAHPALGARIALASQPVAHESHAVMLRYLSRKPISPTSADGSIRGTDFTIAHKAADSLIFSARVGQVLLRHSLRIVDDIGLTTGAATLTTRSYWRAFRPVRGSRACPCGRGRASECGHRWGCPAPVLTLPTGV